MNREAIGFVHQCFINRIIFYHHNEIKKLFFIVGLAALANSEFAGGATDFGIVRSCFGGSALLGTIIAGSVVFKHRGLLLSAITALLGAGLVLMGLAQDVILASLFAGLIGIGSGFLMF